MTGDEEIQAAIAAAFTPWETFPVFGPSGLTYWKIMRRNTLTGESEFALGVAEYPVCFRNANAAEHAARELNAGGRI